MRWRNWAWEKNRIRLRRISNDLAWRAQHDRSQAIRIIRLVGDSQRDPFSGLGKPEPLKHELAGCWSRRIDTEHRLIYQVLPVSAPVQKSSNSRLKIPHPI